MQKKSLRPLVVLAAAALSTLTITCRSAYSFRRADSVELRQVQQVAAVFNRNIDIAIANRSNGAARLGWVDICPDPPLGSAIYDIITLRTFFWRANDARPFRQFTIKELQELRALFNLRVDEAFAAGRDTAAYRDLLAVKIDATGMTGTVAAPRTSLQLQARSRQ